MFSSLRPLLALAALALASPVIAQPAKIDARTAIYELRIYYPAPGKLDALNARFREHTLKIFEKHGMTNVAYWNELPTAEAPDGRVVYILAYPSRTARDADWQAFGNDPEWKAVTAKQEMCARAGLFLISLTRPQPSSLGSARSTIAAV